MIANSALGLRYNEGLLLNDYSSTFSEIRRDLVDAQGLSYLEFRKQLSPKYIHTWFVIGIHWLTLIAIVLWLSRIQSLQVGTLLGGSLILATVIHRLHLYLHEGSHYHLAKVKKLNDFFSNLFIGTLVLSDVAEYRRHHSMHHRDLGLPSDPERTYQSTLNWRFIFYYLSGLPLIKLLLERIRTKETQSRIGYANLTVIFGALMHLSVIVLGVLLDSLTLSVSWIVAVGSLFPLIAATRQTLEHRPIVDSENGPPLTRIFAKGPLTFIFGSAGFDRHLLHHWDPGVPSCRLAELEIALNKMGCSSILQARRSNYFNTFFTVWQK